MDSRRGGYVISSEPAEVIRLEANKVNVCISLNFNGIVARVVRCRGDFSVRLYLSGDYDSAFALLSGPTWFGERPTMAYVLREVRKLLCSGHKRTQLLLSEASRWRAQAAEETTKEARNLCLEISRQLLVIAGK